MILINKIASPGEIKRIEIRPTTVRVILRDGTEILYVKKVTE